MPVIVDADAIRHRLPLVKFRLLLRSPAKHPSSVHRAVNATLLPFVNVTLPGQRVVVVARPPANANADADRGLKVASEVGDSLSEPAILAAKRARNVRLAIAKIVATPDAQSAARTPDRLSIPLRVTKASTNPNRPQ